MELLLTKLFKPQIADHLVIRDDILEKLAVGMHLSSHVSLICAPAGYGKTTVVLEYIESQHCPNAWISLDEGDNDLCQFLPYLITALKGVQVPIQEATEYLASDLGFDKLQAVLTGIINSIIAMKKQLILVLDDYHLIVSPSVNSIIKFLIENQPPNLKLVLISREDPNLPIAKLRVKGRITEIRMEELCFYASEAAEFFKNTMEIELSNQVIEKIAKRTEGWVAGMQLAGLLFKSVKPEQIDSEVERFSGSNSYIIDYLVEEVLENQTYEVKVFLLKTSVLQKLNGDLCNEITGRTDSVSMLNYLAKANLFLIALDSNRNWYRYHSLFSDSIRMGLSLEEEYEIYKKASAWMKNKGHFHEAVEYAIKSKDSNLILQQVEDCVFDIFQNAQIETLNSWLEHIPYELIKKSEVLAVRKSIALFITGKIPEAMAHLSMLGDEFEKSASEHNRGLILSIRALVASYTGRDAEALAEGALSLLQPWDMIARTSMMNTLAKAQFFKGQIQKAAHSYKAAFETGFKMGYTFVTTIALTNYGLCLNAQGRVDDALQLFTSYIEGMSKKFGKPLPFIGITYIAMAEFYYEKNEIETAKDYLVKGTDLCQSISYNWSETSSIHARMLFAIGEKEKSVQILTENIEKLKANHMKDQFVQSIGCLIRLLIIMKDDENIKKYGYYLEPYITDQREREWEDSTMAMGRIYLYNGKVTEAKRAFKELESVKIQKGKLRDLIAVELLLAQLFLKDRDVGKAKEYLFKAIERASSNKYIQVFIEEQAIISELLREIQFGDAYKKDSFVSALLNYNRNFELAAKDTYKGKAKKGVWLDFGEKLSEREIEILRLISQGMSNQEISKVLFISANTTQWHISNIYAKLRVKNRTQALLKAKEYEIIN